MTKRGMLFSRRSDSVIYQGVGGQGRRKGEGEGEGDAASGIEAVAWRGSLVAWADASGVKLFDIQNMIRIAHVDRPSGARAALYPSVSALRPILLFERSDTLLIAWGDCIMSMLIKEKPNQAPGGGEGGGTGTGTGTAAGRRTVECKVAWELDCIACGAIPFDGDHWAVLGLVPIGSDGDVAKHPADAAASGGLPLSGAGNLLELQIISRGTGLVIAADALPFTKASRKAPADSGVEFSLVSSYCTSRMDDAYELEDEERSGCAQDLDTQTAMFDAMVEASASDVGGTAIKRKRFIDPHLKWGIDKIRFVDVGDTHYGTEQEENIDASVGDTDSVYSDDYQFLFLPQRGDGNASSSLTISQLPAEPPSMVVGSARDLVLVRTRDMDDAIAHAQLAGRHGDALRIALKDTRMVRRHSLNRLIDGYLSSLLRKGPPAPTSLDSIDNVPLTLSRLRLAAKATPRLLGGKVEMWRKWVKVFAAIPGGLFVLREYLPVRDPKLPRSLYEVVIIQMFAELEGLIATSDNSKNTAVLFKDGVELFLKTIRSWGPTASISERIKLHRLFTRREILNDRSVISTPEIDDAKEDLFKRKHQTVVGYLNMSPTPSPVKIDKMIDAASSSVSSGDALFSIESICHVLSKRMESIRHTLPTAADGTSASAKITAAALEGLAEIHIMKNEYREAVKSFLILGAKFSAKSLSEFEDEAILFVNNQFDKARRSGQMDIPYQRVLSIIEHRQLHRCLLDVTFLVSHGETTISPIASLIRLVGLELGRRFLVDHCTLPISPESLSDQARKDFDQSTYLPIDAVANQLRATPKLLHWYLTQVFLLKPEIYVKFPNTAVPPRAITDLHRTHLELHIKYAAISPDKKRKLTNIPSLDDIGYESPLLSFLKAALPHGGTRPDDVRRMLEVCREGRNNSDPSSPSGPIGSVKHPHLFARELAYVIERGGAGSEEDSRAILLLHLEGAKSLPLAVAYVERNTAHSDMIWESLISYCMNPKQNFRRKKSSRKAGDGSLFGALLEVAARSGADLAHLVSKIPTGMKIEGLRPRLLAAISDYRVKVHLHEAADCVLKKEKIALLRELSHRSSRGLRMTPTHAKKNLNDVDKSAYSSGKAESISRRAKLDAASLIEEKGVRLSPHMRRMGLIRSDSLAIR